MAKNEAYSAQSGFVHLLIIIAVAAIFIITGLIAASNIKTTKEFPQKEATVKGIMLAKGGSDDGGGDSSGGSSSSNSGSGSSGSGSSGSSTDSNTTTSSSSGGSSGSSGRSVETATPKPTTLKTESTSTPKPVATSTTAPKVKVKTESGNDKVHTEIKFSEDEKIKTRVEDGKTRIDVYSGGVKVRYEIRDGRVLLKAETETGEDQEIPEQEIFKIEDRLSKDGIKVATEGGKLVIAKNNVAALSNFPLQIDLDTNQLIASTSAGVKILTTLPDQAVQNLISAKIISKLNPVEIADQARLGNLTSIKDVITLGERNGVVVYEINGLKVQKLLGFIPLTTATKVFVAAQTGQPVAEEQTLLSSIIDFLSP